MDASSKYKDSLPTAPESILELLDKLKIGFERYDHEPLRTVEDSKANRSRMPGFHIKNLFLRDRKKKNFLLITQEDCSIDLKKTEKLMGCDRLSFGSAERLFEILGVRPGAVSPLALINDKENQVGVFLDNALKTDLTIYVHPLVNDITIGINGEDLRKFFEYSGHKPSWIDFSFS